MGEMTCTKATWDRRGSDKARSQVVRKVTAQLRGDARLCTQCPPRGKQTSKPSIRTYVCLWSHPPQGLQRGQISRGQTVTLQGPGAGGRAQISLKGHRTQPLSPFSSQLRTASQRWTWWLSDAEEGVRGREAVLGL